MRMLFLFSWALTSCQLVVGVRARALADAGAPSDAQADAQVGDAGVTCTNTTTDPKNCGYCGRVCDSTCTNGQCDVVTLIPNLDGPVALAVDDSFIYVARDATMSRPASVDLYDKSGTPVRSVPYPITIEDIALQNGDVFVCGFDLGGRIAVIKAGTSVVTELHVEPGALYFRCAVDGSTLYVLSLDSAVQRIETDGSNFMTLVPTGKGTQPSLATLGPDVYFVAPDKTITSVPKTGGATVVRYAPVDTILGLVSGDGALYFADVPFTRTNLQRLESDGGAQQLADIPSGVTALAYASKRLYALAPDTSTGHLYSVSTEDGTSVELASDEPLVPNFPHRILATDDRYVYWLRGQAGGSELRRTPR